MLVLQRIWRDFRKFENLDAYITIVVAIGIAILNLMGVSVQKYVAPLTLAVLGQMTFTNLMNRHRISELQESLCRSTSSFFMEEFPSEMKKNYDDAHEIWIIGVSLHRAITFNYEKMEKKLRQGHKYKILLVHPVGPGIEMAVSRMYPRKDVASKSASIRTTLQLLKDLFKIAPEGLEVRTIQNPLTYGVVATSPNTASGVLYLEHYTFGISTESLPRFVVRASDGDWYDFFKKEIGAMWEYGIVWNFLASEAGTHLGEASAQSDFDSQTKEKRTKEC